ncbi:NADPH-dependent FMN reductase [Lujinxingia litoralis]|uniref:NADPH-dependent FMN reductase n=1 Tax=Lujinxingia litoralis TaxID=2211119 RepID=A0A328CBB2_9DELT|nr:NAD(P)H-dependent oxidoreductase [Lujinxingia litoralis]RAL25318.1 NADPH-dependent FMN reductase [Lujinxingia litoralis]
MLKVMGFAASLREGSWNGKLWEVAAQALDAMEGVAVERRSFAEFEMPLYNPDLQAQGFPQGADDFKEAIEAADALIVVTPEYNASIPGYLKNALDWVSRYRPVPLRGKPLLLMSASPSMMGGNRGLWQTRIPLEATGAVVSPRMFGLAQAHLAFAEDGGLANAELHEQLVELLEEFVAFGQALTSAQARGQ